MGSLHCARFFITSISPAEKKLLTLRLYFIKPHKNYHVEQQYHEFYSLEHVSMLNVLADL